MENKFSDLNIDVEILKALTELEITVPSEIQVEAIPIMAQNLDMIGQAQTGTGKTFAFGIPAISKINTSIVGTQVLVLTPTRELSLQVSNELVKLIKYKKDIKIATIYGGESYEKQIRALKQKPQVIVGTPGRIIDHMERKTINFSLLQTLILDEADEMLKMGFQEDIETILSTTPQERQTVLFSATMPDFIKKVAVKYQNNPTHVVIKKKSLTVDRIEQYLYYCKRESKLDLLIRLLDVYNFKNCIIFSNTKSKVDEIVTYLQKYNYSVDGIHGDLKQMVRDRVMGSFRAGNIKFLVATDVAARGIDVSGLEAIINFDLPQEDEIYVHRIGRTGRAGNKGLSISLATPSERRKVKIIENFTRSEMTVLPIPEVADINAKLLDRLLEKIMNNIDNDIEPNLKVINKLAAEGIDPAKIINALIDLTMINKKKSYNTIEAVSAKAPSRDSSRRGERDGRRNGRDDRRSDRDSKKSDRDFRSSSSKQYIYAKLNVGKKELLRPQIVLSMIEKLGGVKKENVGDIVIRKSGTSLEITQKAFTYLKKIEGKKYQGTTITVKKSSSMDE